MKRFLFLISLSFCLTKFAYSQTTVFDQLLNFNPGWMTKSITSHDHYGKNGDGSYNGSAPKNGYKVLFHGLGEGRILRLWMTTRVEMSNGTYPPPKNYEEIWIQIDGKTAYRGSPVDFFEGKGPWKKPLVMGPVASSGGFLSYVPFPYKSEAYILFKGSHDYFQVTYREGTGSSRGPNAQELQNFLTEEWYNERSEEQKELLLSKAKPTIIASGPTLLTHLELKLSNKTAAKTKIKVGKNPPILMPFFFGLASSSVENEERGFRDTKNVIHYVNKDENRWATRLPIPLQKGENIELITSSEDERVPVSLSVDELPTSAVHLELQYKEQISPGLPIPMPLYKSNSASQLVSLQMEVISDIKPGIQNYLEGDEFIFTDNLEYPFQHGTGTEDYFNGGWYFATGVHSNPLSGYPRYWVFSPDGKWETSVFDHSIYRHHILDPIVGRSGIDFSMESGDLGDFKYAKYRTLAVAYQFDSPVAISSKRIAFEKGEKLEGKFDSHFSTELRKVIARKTKGITAFFIDCIPTNAISGILLKRTYSSSISNQFAIAQINGRGAGIFFDSFANKVRSLAQDAVWLDASSQDCHNGQIKIEIDSRLSQIPFSEIDYEATIFQ